MRLSSFPRLRFVIWVGKARSPSGKTRSPFAPHCTFQGWFGSTFSRSEMAWRFCRFPLWSVAVSASLHISRLLRSDYLVVLMSSGDFVALWLAAVYLARVSLELRTVDILSWGERGRIEKRVRLIFAKDKQKKIPSFPILLCGLQK